MLYSKEKFVSLTNTFDTVQLIKTTSVKIHFRKTANEKSTRMKVICSKVELINELERKFASDITKFMNVD